MNLKNKYAIGCHVMFYEIEILDEYLNSVKKAVEIVQNPENIIVELFFNISEFFEEIDTETTTKKELIKKFNSKCSEISKLGVLVKSQVYDQNKPYCIADYRRDFNYKWCNVVDYLPRLPSLLLQSILITLFLVSTTSSLGTFGACFFRKELITSLNSGSISIILTTSIMIVNMSITPSCVPLSHLLPSL